MELWFSEYQGKYTKFSFASKEALFHQKSNVQDVSILESIDYGKVVVVDNKIMMSEKDEFIYHEMIVHPAFMIHPNPKKILVIGLGSGHIVREILKYEVDRIDVVERDCMFVEAMKEHFIDVKEYLSSSKVQLLKQEPLSYLRNRKNEYDIIILNAVDHEGWNEILFTRECYGSCEHALTEDGIFITQQASIYSEEVSFMKKNHKALTSIFTKVKYYQAYIPTYPSGQWLFGMASKKYNYNEIIKEERSTKYYNKELHCGAFALPTNIKEIFE